MATTYIGECSKHDSGQSDIHDFKFCLGQRFIQLLL